ncbi:MAG: type II toxin-antitoxin system RelE/ParE family toxin [Bacteroidales bacterium]|nr:type II toxin-antitoxin system RelE/ParE family toxin [Bacteroidales bacterium]MCF8455976.1 type II toxin-antitoxin system RelE/ParE family toxin [Bacteroidales bacterium]
MVLDSILEKVDEIPAQPYRYPIDQFMKDNPGNYRAFEVNNYRIAYKMTEGYIQILRVRYVKREPLLF